MYASALKALCGLKEHFPVPVANLWSHATALLLHEWALQRSVPHIPFPPSYPKLSSRAHTPAYSCLRSRPPFLPPDASHRGEVQRASELCLLLRGVSPEESSLGGEAYVEAQLQWGHSLLAAGRAHECVQATEKLAEYCERKGTSESKSSDRGSCLGQHDASIQLRIL